MAMGLPSGRLRVLRISWYRKALYNLSLFSNLSHLTFIRHVGCDEMTSGSFSLKQHIWLA